MPIRISRHGLTGCPACARHFRVDDVATDTCPFCGAALSAAARAAAARPTLLGRLARFGQTGNALAASLIAAGLGSACIEADQPTADATSDTTGGDTAPDANPADTDPTPDIPIQPLYGGPPPDAVEPGEDVIPQPEYGMPMPDVIDPSEDTQIQPLYGGPPADIVEPAEDIVPQPEYGMPMPDVTDPNDKDAGPSDVDQGDAVPVPLYGLPPGSEP
jgi:hypothetical protein